MNLRKILKEKNIMQKDVAKHLNVRTSTFSQYVTGIREPDHETLLKIAKYLNVTVDYLLGNTDDPRPANKKNKADENHDDPDIITIQRLYKNSSPKDREKFMKLLRITFDEFFPEDNEK